MDQQPTWIGRTLSGRYRIEALLGQGGMSAVYKATDPNLKRVVAVKIIHPHLSSDPSFVQRFESEASAVASLRHPNIVQVYDFNNDNGAYYMVLEFIPGETLQERLKRLVEAGRHLPIEDAIRYAINISDAVGYAHQRGMVHRDIKPTTRRITSLNSTSASFYFYRERYDQAIQYFEKAIRLKPDYAPAINSLGNAYLEKGDWDSAIEAYRKIVEDVFYGTPHFAVSNMALAYYQKKDYRQAEKYFLEALKLYPDFPNALGGLGMTYIAMGRYPDAAQKLERAVRKNPKLPQLHYELGKAYRGLGDRKKSAG